MKKRKIKKIVLTSFSDFCNGMATAWAFACYDAVSRSAWIDLLLASLLGILFLVTSIGIKLKVAL